MNNAWDEIDRRAAAMVRKSDSQLTHAAAVVKFLRTPEGAALYEAGRPLHRRDLSRLPPSPAPARPVTKRDHIWEKIKTRAEAIQKRDRVSFAKAVDVALREDPTLYDQYCR